MVFIAKRSIESTELLPNGQSSQPNYCQMVNPSIVKWSIKSQSSQPIYCQMVNRVNRFIAKRSIESTELLPNGQSSQPNYCQTVNRVNRIIAKRSIESTELLPNGQSSQPNYCQMVNRVANGQSILRQGSGLLIGFRAQGFL